MQPPLRRPGDDVRVVRVAEHGAGFSEGRKSLVALLLLRRRRRCRLLPSTPREREREERRGVTTKGEKKTKSRLQAEASPPLFPPSLPWASSLPPARTTFLRGVSFSLQPLSLPLLSSPDRKPPVRGFSSTGRERAIGRSRLYTGRERSNNFSPRRIRFLFQLEFSRN